MTISTTSSLILRDARRIAARSDIAAAHLRGKVEADRFVEGQKYEVLITACPLKKQPAFDAGLETEAVRGEYVTIYETGEEGWSWGQLERDHYVGYLPSDALGKPDIQHSHRVSVLRTFTYPGPSMKLPVTGYLSLGSRLGIVEIKGDFARTSRGEYIWATHIAPLDTVADDFVAIAEQFLHVPYLWGGKTSLGIDCSGLLQASLDACGINAPRDSDMQACELGEPVEPNADFSNLQRGDQIRWKGHCGIMRDSKTLLHANGFHMMVASENLGDAIARIKANSYGDVTGVRRIKNAPTGG